MVTLDASQIDRAVETLRHLPGAAEQAMARAMNRAIEGARTTAAKEARAVYRVSSQDVKATMRLQRATPSRLEAEVKSTGPRTPLYEFGPTPDRPGTGGRLPGVGMTRPPLRVAVKRRGKGGTIDGAFVARLGGKLRVVQRLSAKRFPIRVLYGPAVPQMMGRQETIDRIERVAQARLDARLDHEIVRALERA